MWLRSVWHLKLSSSSQIHIFHICLQSIYNFILTAHTVVVLRWSILYMWKVKRSFSRAWPLDQCAGDGIAQIDLHVYRGGFFEDVFLGLPGVLFSFSLSTHPVLLPCLNFKLLVPSSCCSFLLFLSIGDLLLTGVRWRGQPQSIAKPWQHPPMYYTHTHMHIVSSVGRCTARGEAAWLSG